MNNNFEASNVEKNPDDSKKNNSINKDADSENETNKLMKKINENDDFVIEIVEDDYDILDEPENLDNDFMFAGSGIKTENKSESSKEQIDANNDLSEDTNFPEKTELISREILKSRQPTGVVRLQKETEESDNTTLNQDEITDVNLKVQLDTKRVSRVKEFDAEQNIQIEEKTEIINNIPISDLLKIRDDSEIISRENIEDIFTEKNITNFKNELIPIEEIFFSTEFTDDDVSSRPLTNDELTGKVYADRSSSIIAREDLKTKSKTPQKENISDSGVIKFEDIAFEITDKDLEDEVIIRFGNKNYSDNELLNMKYKILWEKFHMLQNQNIKIHSSIKRVKNFQQQMLPEPPRNIDFIECETLYKPADQISGDFYDFISLKNGKLALTIGDSAGHGFAPALIMTITKKLLYVFLNEGYALREAMIKTNSYIMLNIPSATFITAIVAEFDPNNKVFSYFRAGHPSLILYNKKKRGPEPILRTPNGMAFGMDSTEIFNKSLEKDQISLMPDDLIVLVTDGVFEISNKKGERFGLQRLTDIIKDFGNGTLPYLIRKINSILQQFRAGTQQDDDLTVLCLKYLSETSADTRLKEISKKVRKID